MIKKNAKDKTGRIKKVTGSFKLSNPENFKITGNNSTDRLLFRTGVAGTAAAALALLARSAFNQVDMESQKSDRNKFLKSQLQADTPEFNPTDTEKQKAEQLKQQALAKQVNLDKQASDWGSSLASSALPLLALYGGAVGGFNIADKISNMQKKKELASEVALAQNDLDATNFARLSLARETPEEAEQRLAGIKLEDEAKKAQQLAHSPAALPKQAGTVSDERTLGSGATNVAGILLGMAALASGYSSYNYFKAADPERQAQRDVKNALRELARTDNEENPTSIARPNPATLQALDAHLNKKPATAATGLTI